MIPSTILLLLLGACSANYTAMSYVDRPCGSDITNLWVDVVALVDNSAGMKQSDLNVIAANIATVFSSTRIGTSSNEPRTTRVGLVTYNRYPTVVADLNQFNSTSDLESSLGANPFSRSNETDSDLDSGFYKAFRVLTSRTPDAPRANYRKVIIVYTGIYDRNYDARRTAIQLRQDGITIITLGFDDHNDSGLMSYLAEIASVNANFSSTDMNSVGEIQGALTRANCFCPDGYSQYHTRTNGTLQTFGTCIQPVSLPVVWRAAHLNCQNRFKNGFLATEFNQDKHDFILQRVKMNDAFQQPYSYWIGLTMVKGVWQWDQPVGWPNPPVQNWTDWDGGVQPTSSTATAVMNYQKGVGTVWRNMPTLNMGAPYVCEVAACDTDNYCDIKDDN